MPGASGCVNVGHGEECLWEDLSCQCFCEVEVPYPPTNIETAGLILFSGYGWIGLL